MVRNPHVRYLLAMLLGGCAGLSFTISVLPVVLQMGRIGPQIEMTRVLVPLWPWAALLWAVGGFSAARVTGLLQSAVVLGVVGAVSGPLLVAFGPGAAPVPMAIGAVSGVIYGGLGGLILGRILAPAEPEESAP